MNPYEPASEVSVSSPQNHDASPLITHADPTLLRRTRRKIFVLAMVPSGLFLLAMLTPHARPTDVIAVVSLAIWCIGFPCLLLAGILVPLIPGFRSKHVAQQVCSRRITQAAFFSMAALLAVGDFWVFGIFAGLKWDWWKYDLPLTGTAVGLTLILIPSRRQFERWTQADA